MKRIEIKIRRKMCAVCHVRRARFMYAGRVRWDRFHSLCFCCYDSFSDRLRAALSAPTTAVTQQAESSLGVSPIPLRMELERSAYPTSTPVWSFAGATGLVAAAGTAQAAA
jgi:hypothetical protein